jgi:hypothetical protein
MDLLESGLGERARCTQAVAAEISAMSGRYTNLRNLVSDGWLGEPIELNEVHDREGVRRTRSALGGTSGSATEHLGEAESIHAMQTRSELRGAVLLTDDRGATHLAKARSLQVWDTTRLLADIHVNGDIEYSEAILVLNEMLLAGRSARIPASLKEFLQ